MTQTSGHEPCPVCGGSDSREHFRSHDAEQIRAALARLRAERDEALRQRDEAWTWLRQSQNPGEIHRLPRQVGADELAVSEAPVMACPYCGQPHLVARACAGEIEEAA